MILHEKAYGATNIVASRLPCEVGNVRGYFRGSTDRWLQLHDASQLPANGAVPVFSIPLYATAYYSWDWPRLRSMSNGAIFAVSTTEATLTISSDLADFFVDGSARYVESGLSVSGDLTTAIETIDIVGADARIMRVKGKVVGNVDAFWLQLFKDKAVSDLVSGTTIPDFRVKLPANTDDFEHCFSFAGAGLLVTKACAAGSTTGPVYTALGNNYLNIESVYKAL